MDSLWMSNVLQRTVQRDAVTGKGIETVDLVQVMLESFLFGGQNDSGALLSWPFALQFRCQLLVIMPVLRQRCGS